MPLLDTDAVVLHAFDYSESSRILRLATREAGVISALARGARRSRKRFGTALDLYAQGAAQLVLKEGRDLQTLAGFDVTHARPSIAADLERFTGAAALAELVLRFGTDDTSSSLFTTLVDALDALAAAPPGDAREAALAGAWRLVAELGFAPSLDSCSACHAPLAIEHELPFSHDAGGVLCRACARLYPPGRTLPPEARTAVALWLEGGRTPEMEPREARAHQRLLREFLRHHVADGRTLRAFEVWEHGDWGAA